jgi:hypothetical protein
VRKSVVGRKKAALFEKSAPKLLSPPAFERPQFGRSKAGEIKSFLVTFFQKSNGLLSIAFYYFLLRQDFQGFFRKTQVYDLP